MDDDDIYPDSNEYVPQESRMQDIDDEEEGEELESDSDDDINFITDAKDEPKTESGSQKNLRPGSRVNDRDSGRPRPSPTPVGGMKRELTPSGQANINRINTPQSDGRPGTDYPPRHTSTLDPANGNPVHPSTGKPILNTDLDADFPDSTKPWRKPGADITDYFNYGFDEFTWASYCLKKQSMPGEIKAINQEAEQMKAFFDNPTNVMPMPGMPGMPGMGGPDMSGQMSQADMQQMMEFMKMQGMPDTNQMNQMAMMMGGPNAMGGGTPQPPSGPAGFTGGHQDGFQGRGGRGRGRGRNW